jgi:hypothetical protein
MSQRIADRHGLRVSTCWTTFLTVLPEPARQRLAAQSTVMLGRAQGVVFAVGALGWTVLAPTPGWAVVWVAVTCSVIGGTYVGLRHSAQSYCDLIEGQVAAHRATLYRAVGFPLPESTEDEPRLGAELSDYLEANAEAAVPLRWAAGEPA